MLLFIFKKIITFCCVGSRPLASAAKRHFRSPLTDRLRSVHRRWLRSSSGSHSRRLHSLLFIRNVRQDSTIDRENLTL